MPSLDIEPHSSPKGPRDRLSPAYQHARTFASRLRSEAFLLLSAHKIPQNGAFRRAQRLAVPRALSVSVDAGFHARDHFQLVCLVRALIARGHRRIRPAVPSHERARRGARLSVPGG